MAFKGNAQLFVHFNEQALAKLNRKMNKSDSLKRKKKLKTTFGDDYNTSLPDEVLAEIRRFREQDEVTSGEDEPNDESILSSTEEQKMKKLKVLEKVFSNKSLGRKKTSLTSLASGPDAHKGPKLR